MEQQRLISDKLVDEAINIVALRLPWSKEQIRTELQDDFQFLLITLSGETAGLVTEQDRSATAYEIDKIMPARDGELSWMLNFKMGSDVVDSYFGGDKNFPGVY